MGLLPYSYCSSGVLVSFFMFTMSYRYKFPSAACRINISILNILNRSRSPVSLLYTGSTNLVVNLYQPNFASTLCFPLKFSCHPFQIQIFHAYRIVALGKTGTEFMLKIFSLCHGRTSDIVV